MWAEEFYTSNYLNKVHFVFLKYQVETPFVFEKSLSYFQILNESIVSVVNQFKKI